MIGTDKLYISYGNNIISYIIYVARGYSVSLFRLPALAHICCLTGTKEVAQLSEVTLLSRDLRGLSTTVTCCWFGGS